MLTCFSWITQPRMHQSSKSLCPSLRGVPEDSKTPPTCQVWMILSQVIAIGRKLKFSKIGLIFNLEKQFLCHFVFCHFLGQYSSESWFLGVFRKPQDILMIRFRMVKIWFPQNTFFSWFFTGRAFVMVYYIIKLVLEFQFDLQNPLKQPKMWILTFELTTSPKYILS